MRIYRSKNGIELAMSRAELEEVRCGRASSRIILADALEDEGIEIVDETEDADGYYTYTYFDGKAENYFQLSDENIAEIGLGFPCYAETNTTSALFEEE